MSSTTLPRRRPARRPAPRHRLVLFALAAGAFAVALAVTVTESEAPSGAPSETASDAPAVSGTAEATTATTTVGVAQTGGIVVEGSTVALGRVPLDRTVVPTWRLHNSSAAPIDLGEPKADVIAGCCPGPLTLDHRTVAPGAHAILTFPLQMHPGMDGPHDFRVTVPVGRGAEPLVLRVTGDFK